MPVAPFIPLIAQGIGMAGGAIAGKKATQAAQQRSPEELKALGGAQDVAGQAAGTGNSLISESRPYMQQAGNYYQTMLKGNRAMQQQAVSPYAAQISDQYRGASRALDQAGVQGAQRQVAAGELNRQRVGQLSGLVTGMQPGAANALAGLGTTGMQAGTALTGQAGTIYGNLLGQGANNRQYARKEGGETGAALGGLIRNAGEVIGGQMGKPKQAPVSTAPVGPWSVGGWEGNPF